MIAYRKAHPSLGRSRFWCEDVHWYGVGPEVDSTHHSHIVAFCLHGASQNDKDIYIMINAYWEDLGFAIQEGLANHCLRVVNTNLDSPSDILKPKLVHALGNMQYTVKACYIVVVIGN